MDGEATDFVIDPNGELVMLEEEPPLVVRVLDGGSVLAVVLQSGSGEVAVQVFGTPTKALVDALYTAVQGLMNVLKQH